MYPAIIMVTVVMVDLASATLIMDTMATLITGVDTIGHTGIRVLVVSQTSMQRIPLLGDYFVASELWRVSVQQ